MAGKWAHNVHVYCTVVLVNRVHRNLDFCAPRYMYSYSGNHALILYFPYSYNLDTVNYYFLDSYMPYVYKLSEP